MKKRIFMMVLLICLSILLVNSANAQSLEISSSKKLSADWSWNLFSKQANANNSQDSNLAKVAMYLCDGTYRGEDVSRKRMRSLGFENINCQYFDSIPIPNTSPICMGSKVTNINNERFLIICVAIRGTNDFGDFITDVLSGVFNTDGFAVSGKIGQDVLNDYCKKYQKSNSIDKKHTIIFVTGHSLGGAIAGQMARSSQDNLALQSHIFCYTFAPPFYQTYGNESSYKNIHNYVNTEDAVPKFPLFGKRNGVDHSFKGTGKDMIDQHMLDTYIDGVHKLFGDTDVNVKNTITTSITTLQEKAEGKIYIAWNKKSVNKYQVRWSLNKDMSNSLSATIEQPYMFRSGLIGGRTYYFQVCTIKIINGKKVPSAWSATKSIKLQILPPKTSITSLTANSKSGFTVKYSKKAKVEGYQIRYSTDSSFKTKKTSSSTNTQQSRTNLTKGKYYVAVRTYNTAKDGTRYYSQWSGMKSVTVKEAVNWKKLYNTYLSGSVQRSTYQFFEPFRCESFALYDINKDGIYELITHGGSKNEYIKIFWIYNNKVKELEWGDNVKIYSNGIIENSVLIGKGIDSFKEYTFEKIISLGAALVYDYQYWYNRNQYYERNMEILEFYTKVSKSVIDNQLNKLLGGANVVKLNFVSNTAANRSRYLS